MDDIYLRHDRRIHIGGTPGARTRRPVRGQVDLRFRMRNQGDPEGRCVSAEPGLPREFVNSEGPLGLAVHDALDHVAGWDTCGPDDPPVRELIALGACLFVRGVGVYAIEHPLGGDWGLSRYTGPSRVTQQVAGTIDYLSIGGGQERSQVMTSFERLKPPRGWEGRPPKLPGQHLGFLDAKLAQVEHALWADERRTDPELWEWGNCAEHGGERRKTLLQWLKVGFAEAERVYVCPFAANRLFARVGYVLGLLTQSYPLGEGGLRAWAPVRVEGRLVPRASTYALQVTPPNKGLAERLREELSAWPHCPDVEVVDPEVEFVDRPTVPALHAQEGE